MDPQLLTPEQAADWLNISRSRVFELIAEGALPSIKIGKSRRVPVEALRRWVERQLTEAHRG